MDYFPSISLLLKVLLTLMIFLWMSPEKLFKTRKPLRLLRNNLLRKSLIDWPNTQSKTSMMSTLRRRRTWLMSSWLSWIRKLRRERKRCKSYMSNSGSKMDRTLSKELSRIRTTLKDWLRSLFGELLIREALSLLFWTNILKERNQIKLRFII